MTVPNGIKPAYVGDGWPRETNETCAVCSERTTTTTDGRGVKTCGACVVPADYHPEMR